MTRLRAKDVEAQLLATNGNMAAVGRALGVRRNTVFGFVARRPELRKLVEQCRETRVDLAESALDRAVARDEPWAVSLVLKTLGKIAATSRKRRSIFAKSTSASWTRR